MNHRMLVAATLCLAAAIPAGLSAQAPASTMSWDFGLAFGDIARVQSVGLVNVKTYTKSQRLSLGYGLRFAYSGGDEIRHFSTGGTGPDTLKIKPVSIASVNINLHVGWKFSDDIDVGANMDIVGLSYGPQRDGDLRGVTPGVSSGSFPANPSWFNYFGFGSDHGTMNSEVFLGYTINPNYKLKLGYARGWMEYTMGTVTVNGDRSFRTGNDMMFLGVRFTP
jgi:hypothetical protein